jgi:Protein of unknown function (DUF732)
VDDGPVQHSASTPWGKQRVWMTNTAIRRTVSVAPAHADPVYDQNFYDENFYDQNFTDYLNQSGVPFKNRTDAIPTAKQCCLDMSRQGGTTYQAANNLVKQEGWTQSEAQTFVQAAVPTPCPGASG